MTIQVMTTFVTHTCPSARCGVSFAVEAGYDERRRDDHRDFYCPNGHTLSYRGKSEADKQRERAERLERQLANAQEDARAANASRLALKGQVTKIKNRIAKGVCPCCNRSFVDLRAHMEGQHPEYAPT